MSRQDHLALPMDDTGALIFFSVEMPMEDITFRIYFFYGAFYGAFSRQFRLEFQCLL